MKQAIENMTQSRNAGVTAIKKNTNNNLEEMGNKSQILKENNLGGLSKIAVGGGNSGPGNVNVVCRFRPLNEKEKNISAEVCCDFLDPQRLQIRSQGENNLYKFSFDRIFDLQSNQQEVYEYAAKPIIESVLEGFNGTILAYGQTASGKTHTMQGVLDDLDLEGIIPRMIRNIFTLILNSSADLEYTVKTSMIEIYQEKIRDLVDVSRTNLNVREDKAKGLYIEDLSEHYMASEEEVLEIMKLGSDNRSIGATNMNEHSSRSHSIFIMTIHQTNIKDLTAKTGKLYLVDLAGSEKISKTGATGLTLEEAKTINKSLTTLGMVINSLTDGKSTHVPYRESKLTRVLQESLGGNSKTCLIITCSPSVYNDSETLSTLRFGLRAKKIKNKPKINKETTVAELKIELERLDLSLNKCHRRIAQLETYIRNNNLPVPNEDDLIEENIKDFDEEVETKIRKQIVYVTKENEEKPREGNLGFGLMSEQLKYERDFNKFNEKKIFDINHKVYDLEEDKRNLKDKLDDAIESLRNVYIEIDDKINLIDKLENIKVSYDLAEKELISKLGNLEIQLKEEKEKNYLNYVNKQELESENKEEDEESNYSRRTISNQKEDDILNVITDNYDHQRTSKIELQSVITINEFFDKLQQITNLPVVLELIEEYKPKLETNENDNKKIEENNGYWEAIIEEEKNKYENEKKIIMKALEDKSERLGQFEVENKDLLEKMKNLESKINPEEKINVKKILILEKNLEQLNKMFQHAMAQKSTVILDKESLDNKIKKRNQKINLLEKEINEMKDQIKIRDEKMSFLQIQRGTLNRALTTGNNVVRIIKGGHLKQNAQIMEQLNLNRESTQFFYNKTDS